MTRGSPGCVPLHSFTLLPHHLPQGLPCHHWTSNCGWVPLGVGTPLPQPPLRGAGPRGPAFTFAPPPPRSLRTQAAGGGLVGQRIRPRISTGSWGSRWAGEIWPCSVLILCPPNGSPISPFRHGIPSPPPAPPQGCQSHPPLHFSSPFTPHVVPGCWGFLPSP